MGAVGAVDGAAPTILVAGADPLGLAVVERLVQSGASVTMLAEPTDASRHGHEIERIGARLVVGSARSSGELLAAGLEMAHVLVLTANDDPENVDATLTARRLRPDLPLIVRLFDPIPLLVPTCGERSKQSRSSAPLRWLRPSSPT